MYNEPVGIVVKVALPRVCANVVGLYPEKSAPALREIRGQANACSVVTGTRARVSRELQ